MNGIDFVGEKVSRVWLSEDGSSTLGFIHGSVIEYLPPVEVDDVPLYKMKHATSVNTNNTLEKTLTVADFEDLVRTEIVAGIQLYRELAAQRVLELKVSQAAKEDSHSEALSKSEQAQRGAHVYGIQEWTLLCTNFQSLNVIYQQMKESEYRRDIKMCVMLEEILDTVEDEERRRMKRIQKQERMLGYLNGSMYCRRSSRQMLIEQTRLKEEEENKQKQLRRRIEEEEKRLQRQENRRKLESSKNKILNHANSFVTVDMPQELYALEQSVYDSTTQRSKHLWYVGLLLIRRLVHESIDNEWFYRPVTRNVAPDYHKVVACPMDLGTIFCKLLLHQYKEVDYSDFVADVSLIWTNSIRYNGNNTPVTLEALYLKGFFEKGWNELVGVGIGGDIGGDIGGGVGGGVGVGVGGGEGGGVGDSGGSSSSSSSSSGPLEEEEVAKVIGDGTTQQVQAVQVVQPAQAPQSAQVTEAARVDEQMEQDIVMKETGTDQSTEQTADKLKPIEANTSTTTTAAIAINAPIVVEERLGCQYFQRQEWLEHFKCLMEYTTRAVPTYDLSIIPSPFLTALEILFIKVMTKK